MPALQIGLNKAGSKPKVSSQNPLDRRKPIFGDEEDDDDKVGGSTPATKKLAKEPLEQGITTFDETISSPTSAAKDPISAQQNSISNDKPSKPTPKHKLPTHQHTAAAPNLSTLRTLNQQTANVDPSVYDYDAAYDALHAADTRRGGGGKTKNPDADGHLVSDLLAAAEVRKRDQQRARERLLQKEREAEGDEFADKEAFVTDAYRAQQAEDAIAAEREAAREAEDARKRQAGHGMSGFYRGFMEQEEKRHQEMVEAAARGAANPAKEGTAAEAPPTENSEAQAARELAAQGKNVGVNDEGQVVDKRELLTAGLNVAPKPKATGAESGKPGAADAVQRQDARGRERGGGGRGGRGDAHRAMRERQTRMMEAQLEAAAKRSADEDAAEQARLERAAKSQKTASDVSSARERYLQRKREAAEAASRGDAS